MNNSEIRSYWLSKSQEVLTYLPSLTDNLGLREHTSHFLAIVGLPTDAAPFLSFSSNKKGEWNSLSRITDLDNSFDNSFANLIQIGSDGSGNPIVVDTANDDTVKLIDHDNSFSLHSINQSIEAFASSLVTYAMFIDEVLSNGDDDRYFDTHFTDKQFEHLQNQLALVESDNNISNFWQNELALLASNRKEYRNEMDT